MGRSDPTQARLEFAGSPLGTPPPPVDVHVRAWLIGDDWVLYLWDEHGNRARVLQWLRSFDRVQVMNSASHDEMIAARVPDLSKPWSVLFEDLSVDGFVVSAEGDCEATVRGPRERLQAVVGAFEDAGIVCHLRLVGSVPDLEQDLLTAAEHEAIRAAYEAGYFDVPRETKLSELAEAEGTSSAALSTAIRRGLGRLVENYVGDQEPDEETWPPLRFDLSSGEPETTPTDDD